ncbi:hypothetical protein [Halobacterium salinarum]|uniref:hypothetical protein n=1 Tax=Halobacterium salinarum TaxID=2242 RepID=UPI001F1E8F0A|nr:hypothetical protein [Halobacterium salinarum]MCF2165438.1 hypothetical protein [Halobacterium salinarum]MCF2168303.1 hypothetical protein [Halobacterium salinarum]
MSDDPFDDLDETIEENSDKSEDSEPTTTASTSTTGEEETSEDTNESRTTGEQTVTEETVDPYETRAFEYGEEATQFPFYVREDTLEAWQVIDDVEVTPALARDGVKNVSTSEKHDAMVRMALDNPALLAEYIKEARGIPDADTDAIRDRISEDS